MRKVAWLLSGLLALTTAAYAATPIAGGAAGRIGDGVAGQLCRADRRPR